jgi:MFS family permease
MSITPTPKRKAAIFGVPLAWIAAFGALIGVFSIVPMIFYIFGGGFLSAGMIIFSPLAGIIMGPWAGYIAGLIGGLIGMLISPASYPLGFIDANLSGAFIPLYWGLVKKNYWKFMIPWWILWIIVALIWPYHIPGPAGGYKEAPEPYYSLSWAWSYIGFALYLATLKFLNNWISENSTTTKKIAGFIIYNFIANTAWMVPWKIIYFALLKYPPETVVADNIISWWAYTLPMVVATTIIAYAVVEAMRKSGMYRPPGGVV